MNYLRLTTPWLYFLAQPFQLVDDTLSAGVLPDAVPQNRNGGIVEAVRRVGEFLEHPTAVIDAASLVTEADAQLLSDIFFGPAVLVIGFLAKRFTDARVLKHTDIAVLYGWEADVASTTPIADAISKRTLSFSIGSATPEATDAFQGSIESTIAFVPQVHGGPGVFLSVGGAVAFQQIFGEWKYTLKLLSEDAFSLLFDKGITASGPADAGVEFSVEHMLQPNGLPQTIDIGSTRIELGDIKLTVGVNTSGFSFHALADKSSFVIDTSSDPVTERGAYGSKEALRVQVGLGFGYQNGAFSFDGGSGLLVTIPLTFTAGPFSIRAITLGLQPSSQPGQPYLAVEGTLTFVVKICGLVVTVDRLGLGISLQEGTGLDVDRLGPKGVGIAIQTDAVSGGGYLFYDKASSQYAGVIALSIKNRFSVTAVGLLTTKIDGKKAFSLLILASLTGLDIEITMGFKITGFGLLIGIDREINMTALEAGVQAHSLDSLMFPKDPIANAPAIVTAAAAAFPPRQGQYLLGAMVQLSWGASSLVRLEVAVVVQLPGFSRLVILGKARAFCPTEKNAVLKIQLDMIGDFDFDQKRAFAYAKLTDSKLATLALAGEAALLIYWGDNSTLLISAGGFNPRYISQVPSEFPSLKRVSISFKKSDALKIEVDFYFAVTSHSFQIGGAVALKAKESKFSIEGMLSVDALFESGEPAFVFDLKAQLELKAWDVTLFMVRIEGTLAGCNPKHVQAKCTFEIFIFSYTFSVDKCWGGDPNQSTITQASTDVSVPFLAALADPASWSTNVPTVSRSLLTMRPGTTQNMLHPLGTLSVTECVVPLGITIDRFGSAPVQGQTLFAIDGISVGGITVPYTHTQDQFARSQFLDLTNDQKLSTPAFERMDAGIATNEVPLSAGTPAVANTQYRTFVYDAATGEARPDVPATITAGVLSIVMSFSAAARATRRSGGTARYKAPASPVKVTSLTYVVASTGDLSPATSAGQTAKASSFTAAAAAFKDAVKQNPSQRHDLQVLPVAK